MKREFTALLACSTALTWSSVAVAQAQPVDDVEQTAVEPEDGTQDRILVTGSRILRSGVEEPTPVTIVAIEELQQAAPTNIPDALNQLPQFAGSRSAVGGGAPLSNANEPRAGNYLNLRNVGSQRMLILLDGRRVPPTSFEGIVDANTIPQGLVERVDVVTAGASAVYGADAITGVVNFVLDTDFTGLRGSAQAGISDYGDNENWRISLTGGTPFAGGRGHIIASYDHFDSAGVPRKDQRPYLFEPSYFQVGRGTADDPFRTETGAVAINRTSEGVIVGAANAEAAARLRYFNFFEPDRARPLVLGEPTQSPNVRLGGEGNLGNPSTVLAASLRTDQLFGRIQYELTDTVTAFVQGSFNKSFNEYDTLPDNRSGGGAVFIFDSNPFIPDNVQQILQETGADFFRLGKAQDDLHFGNTQTDNESWMTTLGVEGFFDFLADGRWDLFYTHGESELFTSQTQTQNNRYFAAIDAVDEGQFLTGTPNGNIVCRVALTNPELVPGCIPYNVLGSGRGSQAAAAWFTGQTEFRVRNKLDEIGFNAGGTLFDLGAGPAGFNIGAAYRSQSLVQTSNSDPAIPVDYTGGSDPNDTANYTGIRGVPGLTGPIPNPPQLFNFTNVGVAEGSKETKEVYGEMVLPLLADLPAVQSFELNGAVRFTDYSTSGGVWTWKAGGIWQPVYGVRIRATYSRDIREPTLYDLFAGQQQNPSFFNDEQFTGLNNPTLFISGGNPDLTPEVGNTLALGVVLQPDFLPGFSASVDYYDLKIKDAISNINPNVARDQCASSGGTDPLCDLIVRPFPITNTSPENFPVQVLQFPVNIASIETSGIDFDVNYRTPLDFAGMDGSVSVRWLANRLIRFDTNSGAGARTFELAGLVGRSKWRHTISASYSGERLGVFLQARIVGEALRDTPGNNGNIYVQQEVPAEAYLTLTVDYELDIGGNAFTPFLTVNNLLDNKAPILSNGFTPGVILQTDTGTYDIIGRQYTAGVRFQF